MKIKKETIDIICTLFLLAGVIIIFLSIILKSKDRELYETLKWIGLILIIPNGVNSIINLIKMRNSGKKIAS
jgi:uncharacterized membrane protein